MAKSNSKSFTVGGDKQGYGAISKDRSEELSAQERVIANLKEEYKLRNKTSKLINDDIKKLEEQKKEGKAINEIKLKQLKHLQNEYKLLKRLQKVEEDRKKILEESLKDNSKFVDGLRSLGVQVGKNNKLFEAMDTHLGASRVTLKNLAKIVSSLPKSQKDLSKQIINSAEAYKNLSEVQTNLGKKLMQEKITRSEYNESVINAYENLDEMISKIDQSSESGKAAAKVLQLEKERLEEFAKAAEKSKNQLQGLNFGLSKLSSSGVPAMGEFGQVVQSAAEGGKVLTLAIAALGFALGKLAYDLGFVGSKFATIAKYDKLLAPVEARIATIKNQIEGAVAVQRAGGLFGFEVARMGAEFQAAAATGLFGDKLGGVGYGAAQLQMAGISAEKIASSMQQAAAVMGSNVSAKFGADIAMVAQRTGQSEENIANINETFMRLSGVTKETALNLQEGVRAMAAQANVNLGAIMEDIAEASKDALSYQIKSAPALAKAVTYARSIGVSFNSIAKAGQNMVLNYKDSIKSELQLSAMLGRRVNLTRVRALFAAGDQAGALRALRAQGLNPAQMNMFQQQALSQALGGMDLNDLQRIAQRGGRAGELRAGGAGAANAAFLGRAGAAQAGLFVQNAAIQVKEATYQIETEKLQKEAWNAQIQSSKDLQDLLARQKRLETEKEAATGMGGVMSGLIGSAITTGLFALLTRGKGFGRAGGGMFNMLSKGGGTKGVQMIASKSGKMFPINSPQGRMIATKGGTMPLSQISESATAAGKSTALKTAGRVGGGVLSVLGAALDYSDRVAGGQTKTQAIAGAGAGAAGGWAGAEFGATLGTAIAGPIGTVVGGLLGGAIGYFGASSIADKITGANEKVVDSNSETNENAKLTYDQLVGYEATMTQQQIQQAVKTGQMLDDSTYMIELQKEMVAELGLANTILYDIAESNRLVGSVNIDGTKVMETLANVSRRQFGVARTTAPGIRR